ncbi:MAG: hypothetical protein LBO66_05390 [Deltaproteobacteria bacterium]|jgi:hypothetical protein|nr:hypothetical protein [Deltaproteobacteria bacterium]
MFTREKFSLDNSPLKQSAFTDAIKAAEAVIDKLELLETRSERTGKFYYTVKLYAKPLTEGELGLACAFFEQAVPQPSVSICFSPSNPDWQSHCCCAAATSWLPLKNDDIIDKFNSLHRETKKYFSSRRPGERIPFTEFVGHIVKPLTEYVFSKIPQDLLE